MAVVVNLNILAQLKDALASDEVQGAAARQLMTDMKQSINAGLSPVRNEGRYEAYKDPKNYPGARKPSRPVNLNLTGDMLRALDYRVGDGKFTVGWFGGTQGAKADGHNNGTAVLNGARNEARFRSRATNRIAGPLTAKEYGKEQLANERNSLKHALYGLPRRPLLPTDSGAEFTVTITRNLADLYAKLLLGILSK